MEGGWVGERGEDWGKGYEVLKGGGRARRGDEQGKR